MTCPVPSRIASRRGARLIYQHPLAYLLGLEGIALLHAFAGEYDRDFVGLPPLPTRRIAASRWPCTFSSAETRFTPADWSRSRGIEPRCRMTRGRGPTSEKA